MRIIVIGAGEVGRNIAATLSVERHDVTVVDSDAARVEAMQGQLDALVVSGNGASPKVLEQLGAADADLFAAVTQTDEVNVIAALAAHQLGARRTVARVRDTEYFDPDASSGHDVLGIDFVIHPERATAEDLADAILLPGAVRVEYFGDGRLAIAETILTDRSPLVGQPLDERPVKRPHYVVGVIHEGEARTARGDDRLEVNDHVLVAAATTHIGEVAAHLAGHARKVRDVVIFGGGRVGLPLARRLERAGHFHTTIMERDPDRARAVAEQLDETVVLHEEGVSKEAMLAHGVHQAGAFVACAGDDRANMLAAMHAKQLGADLCLAVVSREEFVPLVDELGIDAAFSPRLATAEAILRFVRGANVRAMHLLFSGSEVLELCADPGSPVDGRTISEIKFPRDCEVAAILRGEQVVIPRDGERIIADDRVLLFGATGTGADVEKAFDA